jgi:4a-hydroxytetrahydrobiopterin dehydratase
MKDLKLWIMKLSSGDNGKVEKISRKFTCKNFQSALDAINDIGAIAEREGHHPDLHITSYRNVEIELFTHSVGGLTMNDIELAKMIDSEVKINYSPKYLRENSIAKETAKQDQTS